MSLQKTMDERDFRIADEHADGATFTELAARYGLTRQRCHQIDKAVKKARARSSDELYSKVLRSARRVGCQGPSRAYNAIIKHEIEGTTPTWDQLISIHGVSMVTAAVIAGVTGTEIPDSAMDELKSFGYFEDDDE